MDATTIAAVIADYLDDRDDVASATPRGFEVEIVTQAGESYLLSVNEA